MNLAGSPLNSRTRLEPSRRRKAIERYLADVLLVSLPILEYGRKEAERHAQERARLAAIGRTPPFVDGQIAAIAREHGLILVASNTRDFQLFEGLTLETWI